MSIIKIETFMFVRVAEKLHIEFDHQSLVYRVYNHHDVCVGTIPFDTNREAYTIIGTDYDKYMITIVEIVGSGKILAEFERIKF